MGSKQPFAAYRTSDRCADKAVVYTRTDYDRRQTEADIDDFRVGQKCGSAKDTTECVSIIEIGY